MLNQCNFLNISSFLQGKCFLNKCSLSHDVGPEKMPTCKYFLEGCCTRDACPYLHVKVSSNTSICIDFLQGYCAKGNKVTAFSYILTDYSYGRLFTFNLLFTYNKYI